MGNYGRRSSKRNRKVSDRIGIVDDADRQMVAQARIDALEDGGAEDPTAADDNDDEFDADEEDDDDVSAKGKKRRRGSAKKKARRFQAPDAARSFAILLEESGLLEKQGTPDEVTSYLTVGAAPTACGAPRKFCSVCGNASKYTCVRCGSLFCCLRCNTTHVETRCLKFAL